MAVIETDDLVAEYEDTPEIRDAVFERVLAYFKEFESFRGESIFQSDDPTIYAPHVLADIADDILQFKVRYKDEE